MFMNRLRARLLSSSASAAGGGHHNHSGGATLFGEAPLAKGQKRQWQGWEMPIYIGYAAGVIAFVSLLYAPNTNLTDWARDEAIARNQRIKEGKEVKTGVNYSQHHYLGLFSALLCYYRRVAALCLLYLHFVFIMLLILF